MHSKICSFQKGAIPQEWQGTGAKPHGTIPEHGPSVCPEVGSEYLQKGEVQDQKNLPLNQATGKSHIKIQEGAGKHVKKPEELQLELF